MPLYEHFSFYQNVFFVQTDDVERTLQTIIEQTGRPDLLERERKKVFSSELIFTPERHRDQISSLLGPLHIELTFSRVGS